MRSVLPGPKPPWLRRPGCLDEVARPVEDLVKQFNLHTVCTAAACPNCRECFGKKRATFLLLGETCTRGCRYCNILPGRPQSPDDDEPQKVAQAAAALGLKHLVLTSVTRDDLPDGGCGHFCSTVAAVRQLNPQTTIEVLIPDFAVGVRERLFALQPEVLNHNIETVESLFPAVRPRAGFKQSLQLLEAAANAGLLTKSGFMVGLGENPSEVSQLLGQLAAVGVKIVTIGQYLPPSSHHWPVKRYVQPEEYDVWAEQGRQLGIKYVFAGPLVRSSYMAETVFAEISHGKSCSTD